MTELRCISLPGRGLLGWNHPDWVQVALPADSWKKRIVRLLARTGTLRFASRQFDGAINLGGNQLRLARLLALVSEQTRGSCPAAFFVNSRRNPPRAYFWLASGKGSFFLKIGLDHDIGRFRNEFEVASKIEVPPEIRIARPLRIFGVDGCTGLISMGIPDHFQWTPERLSPRQIVQYIASRKSQRRGLFGGPVHGDLASNNVFSADGKLWVVDWEFATATGPDFCDLVGLAAAVVAQEFRKPADIGGIQRYLKTSIGCTLPSHSIRKCLEFLAARGNRQAGDALGNHGSLENHGHWMPA